MKPVNNSDRPSYAKVIRALDRLVRACQDAEKCYGDAAADVRDGTLKGLFDDNSYQRALFADALQDALADYGGASRTCGTVGGALQRAWLDLAAAMIGRDVRALLAVCERTDEVVVQSYERALQEALPVRVDILLREQLEAIRGSLEEVHRLHVAPDALLREHVKGGSHA